MIPRKISRSIDYLKRSGTRRRIRRSLSIEDSDLLDEIRKRNLTYLSIEKFHIILKCCREVEQKGLNGIFIETGCALGGSAIMIAAAKVRERVLEVYDVFDRIPEPTEKDTLDVHSRFKKIKSGLSKGINGDQYYGYQTDLQRVVESNIKSFGFDLTVNNISLIKGLLQDTLHPSSAVALAHIDVDWYEPVYCSLERIFPKLVSGGIIILDDYHYWGGCKKAVDEYLKALNVPFDLDMSGDSVVLRKV